MLKNSYLEKYKTRNKKLSEFEKKILSEDGNYITKLQRPLSIKEINKFSKDKLQIFIDDMMSNKKINKLLYSNNYKKEIQFTLKHQNILLKHINSANNLTLKQNKMSPCQSLFNQKKKTLMLDMIKDNISNFKLAKSLSMKKLKIKNYGFYKTQQGTEKINNKSFYKTLNDARYQGYQRSFKYCLEKSKSNPNFNLPEIDLKLDNVYSRLYHNMVFYPIKLKYRYRPKIISNKNKKKFKTLINLKNINNIKIDNNKDRKSIFTNLFEEEKKKNNLKVKNTFREYLGKEFMVIKSYENRQKCWKKTSGGPRVIDPDPGKLNLNKFKIKKLKENYFLENKKDEEDDIIDVNDYKDKNLNSHLHLAIKKDNEEFVKYFLKKNYNPNEQNKFGDTPLHYAVELKNKQIIQLLIDNGGDLYIKNNKGICPYDLTDKEIRAYFKLGNYI